MGSGRPEVDDPVMEQHTHHPEPPPQRPRHRPVEIAPDTWVVQETAGEGVEPVAVHMNSMVIRGAEPVIVDTGVPGNQDRFLEDAFAIVDPDDVRWIFISHDDVDHYGNLVALAERCPDATVVGTWFLQQRLADEVALPPNRWRWLGDGETLDVGDRTLGIIRPPLYDSPTTRGLFDPRTGVYWASDCYAAPVATGTAFAEDLDLEQWAGGMTTFALWNSPWATIVDPAAFARECGRIEDLDLRVIASCHGPAIEASLIQRAHAILRQVPAASAPPQPDQSVLDQIIAAFEADLAVVR